MSRRVITKQLQVSGSTRDMDTYFDRVIKYVPTDIVAAWVAANGLIRSSADVPQDKLLWISFGFGLVLTAAWTLKQTAMPNKPLAVTQTVIAIGAFTVWVFALGGPFETLAFYRPVYGSLILILYTLVAALVIPREDITR